MLLCPGAWEPNRPPPPNATPPAAGRTYRPNVVRVGGDSAAVSPAVRERLLPRRVERYGAMPQPEWQQRCADAVARLQRAAGEVSVLEMSVARSEGAQQATKMAAVRHATHS